MMSYIRHSIFWGKLRIERTTAFEAFAVISHISKVKNILFVFFCSINNPRDFPVRTHFCFTEVCIISLTFKLHFDSLFFFGFFNIVSFFNH